MDGASGAFAVVSVTLQLADTVQKAAQFLKKVNSASHDLSRLINSTILLSQILVYADEIVTRQKAISPSSGAIPAIENAVEDCERHVGELNSILKRFENLQRQRNGMRRKMSRVQFVIKEEDIETCRTRVQESYNLLQNAIIINSSLVLLSDVHITRPMNTLTLAINDAEYQSMKPTKVEMPSQDSSLCNTSLDHIRTQGISTEQRSVRIYEGIFGSVEIRNKTKSLKSSPDGWAHTVSQQKSFYIMCSFFRTALDIRFNSSFGYISRSLRYIPVLPYGSPVFDMCRSGQLERLQAAFTCQQISPFATDQWGNTLLHYAARGCQTNVGALLIRLGVDPELQNHFSLKALAWATEVKSIYERTTDVFPIYDISREQRQASMLRLLVTAQGGITYEDRQTFESKFCGSPEGAEVFHSSEIMSEPLDEYDYWWYPPLVFAVFRYSNGQRKWAPYISKLLRQGVDVHELASKWDRYNYTALDWLFIFAESPLASYDTVSDWLRLPEEAGYDKLAYLRKESDLHAPQQYQTFEMAVEGHQRVLLFQLGELLTVTWDWLVDPELPGGLICYEFRHAILPQSTLIYTLTWEEQWPFFYPEWLMGGQIFPDHCRTLLTNCRVASWHKKYDVAMRRSVYKVQKKPRSKNASMAPINDGVECLVPGLHELILPHQTSA
ncbi:uncharacterized protein KY384_001705 [Bacidia gigantensis]|uniref:uncharacterized protein n=1 Tax=Bacidia gigantensis TaxID=2732470 RepID=UPI001D03799A|nr:uncharacterized protein KY384_001705 [Bacidia gigantensis]KAG8533962.1 hypothetical protein KY384_001705 [Bacidia gigantensis]